MYEFFMLPLPSNHQFLKLHACLHVFQMGIWDVQGGPKAPLDLWGKFGLCWASEEVLEPL